MTQRERLLMDAGWRFYRGDIPFPGGHGGWMKSGNFNLPPIAANYNDETWRTVDLPHDFVVEGDFSSRFEPVAGNPNIPGMEEGTERNCFCTGEQPRKRLGYLCGGAPRRIGPVPD